MTGRGRAEGLGALTVSRRKGAPSREQLATFFEGLAETGNVRSALAEAGVDSRAAYRRRKTDPAFARLWEEALEEATTRLEGLVLEAALTGGAKKGEAAGFDPQLAMRVLASREARLRRGGTGARVKVIPIDEVERILTRRIAAVEKRLAAAQDAGAA